TKKKDMHLETQAPPDTQQELLDPTTGEIVDPTNVDDLIACYMRVAQKSGELYDLKKNLARRLYAMTSGDTKTRRLRGERLAVKVEAPDDEWDSSVLRAAWERYPALRDEFLKIESIGVRIREWKKLHGTAGVSA